MKNAKKVIAKAVPEITKAVEQGKLKVSAAAVVSDHSADVQHQAAIKIAAGAKGSDVVKALPPSPAKAKASAPAPVKLSKEQKKAQEKAKDVWASLYLRLEEGWADDHDGEDLWDYDASESGRCWIPTNARKFSMSRRCSCLGSAESSIRRKARRPTLSQNW